MARTGGTLAGSRKKSIFIHVVPGCGGRYSPELLPITEHGACVGGGGLLLMFDEVPREHEYHNLGNDCYRLGQYDKAVAHYTKALELDSCMVETYFNRALAYARLGQYDAALTDATRVLNENGKLYDAYYLRGRIWELRLDDQAAVTDYRTALELNLSFQMAAEQLHLITSRRWVYRELRQLRDQIELEPTNGYLRFQFGQRLSMIGHHDDALRALEMARANSFVMADFWIELGQVYVALGRTVQGMTAFRQAIRVNPTEVAAYAHLGQLLTEAGRYREAVGVFRHALSMPNDDVASLYCGLGTALVGLKHWNEAREAFERAIAMESHTPEAALGLAVVAWRQGEHEAAGSRCQQALEHSPRMPSALILAVNIAFSQGDLHAASEKALHSFQTGGDNERLAYLLWALARYAVQNAGRSEAARKGARFWETHASVVEAARRLVLDLVKTRRDLLSLQRDLSEELICSCPLAEEASEALYQRLISSPRDALEALYADLAHPGIIAPVERLRRAAERARHHDEEWLADALDAYCAVLSGTPEAPRLCVLVRALARLHALRVTHADTLLDLYRLCLEGLAADSVEALFALAPRISRLATSAAHNSPFVASEVASFLFDLAGWLEQVEQAACSELSSEAWTEIVERGLDLRNRLSEAVSPPEQWALAAMLTNFGTVTRQHVPTP